MFYPRNTPSMIVNNIPQSTVVQMAAFQFGDRPVWVGSSRSEQREYLNSMSIFARLGEPIRARTREDKKRSYSRAAFFSFPLSQSHSFSGHKSVTFWHKARETRFSAEDDNDWAQKQIPPLAPR
jgi:hypothetical protein